MSGPAKNHGVSFARIPPNAPMRAVFHETGESSKPPSSSPAGEGEPSARPTVGATIDR
jgi:hypothetical protein